MMEPAKDSSATSDSGVSQGSSCEERTTDGSSVASAASQNSNSRESDEHRDTQIPDAQKLDNLQGASASGDNAANTPADGSPPTEKPESAILQIPKEHARLDALLGQIPKKAQHGLLMQCDLVLTCIDADDSYIALGTNIGLTFLYNRKDQSMQRLKSETSSDVITCVKLHHGVDHQVAAGMASGTLCIFLIPGYISLHKKQLQKFEVKTVHRHYITCVEWSTNGMKLYSGDKTGHVVCTEVDFYQGLCKSVELLVEPPTEIVQLHYDHKALLVSTKVRSFVCRLDTKCEMFQIGQKDRKVQGNFGACFIPGLCKTDDAKLYAVRPGCRVWLSDIRGVVCNTHIFKDQLASGVHEIPLLRPGRIASLNTEQQFGRLGMYRDTQLVTYNQSAMFILDPALNKVVARVSRLGGIVDVAVVSDEIFILRRHTEDAVIRLAENPEQEVHLPAIPADLPLPGLSMAEFTTGLPPAAAAAKLAAQKPEQRQRASSPKSFFKKTIFSPFKKLDNLIHDQSNSRQTKDSENSQFFSSGQRFSDSSNSRAAETARAETSPDLPPVVELCSPDLAVRVFTGAPPHTSPKDVQSPDSAHSALSAFADEMVEGQQDPVKIQVTGPDADKTAVKTRQEHQGPVADRIHLSTQTSGNDDIVFSHHSGKKKHKKKKQKGGDKDGDNISRSSFGSTASEDTRSIQPEDEQREQSLPGDGAEVVSVALRRADEALTSVDRILKGLSGTDDEGAKENSGTGEKGMEESGVPNVTTPGFVNPDGTSGLTKPGVVTTSGLTKTEVERNLESSENVSANDDKSKGAVSLDTASSQTLTENNVKTESNDSVVIATQTAESNSAIQNAKKDSQELVIQSALEQENTAVKPKDSATSASKETKTEGQKPKLVMPSSLEQLKGEGEQTGKLQSLSSFEEGEDPFVAAAEESLYKMTGSSRASRQESADDFYSRFSEPYSPGDMLESPVFAPSDSSPLDKPQHPAPEAERQISNTSGGSDSDRSVIEATVKRLANSWSEFTAPANIYSLALSDTHIWFTDKSENLYYSSIGGAKGILWRKVGEPANQISVSPSGHIVWRLYRGRVFAGTKITHRRPEGLKWVEAVRDVSHVSADDRCAWYVKTNGEVMMQRGLSKERPCFRSISVPCPVRVKKVIARYGVVWAITESLKLLVRTGITDEAPQGTDWKELHRQLEPFLFSSCSIDSEHYGWAVDVLGQIWFTDRVTPATPAGSGHWWQVPLSEYYVQDPTMLDMIRSIAKKFDRQKLSYVLSTSRGGLITAGAQGVWLALDYLNRLHVCRASLQGYYWSPAQPSKMAESTTWKQVQVSNADLDWGLVWAQQVNGELYTIPPDSSDATLVSSALFLSLAVNEHSVWGLTDSGEVHVRTGMGQHCPMGAGWAELDLSQLGDAFLVHLSCNNNFVWAVDAEGQVFNRIGATAPRPGQLNPVWLPIDTYSEIVFTKVVNGPVDWMVWALDNRRLTYVRVGITEEMPIGREWVHVPGIQAMDLALSSSGVWALNYNGEVFFRYGISQENVSGNYWKKIPGSFLKISSSPSDVLWAINTTGQLVKCSTQLILRQNNAMDPLMQRGVSSSTNSEEGDWELV